MAVMSWRAEWNAISARIEGLVRAGEFFYRSIEKHGEDARGTAKRILLPRSAGLYERLVRYEDDYAGALPARAVECLHEFKEDFQTDFEDKPAGGGLTHAIPYVQLRLTALSAFRAEFEYHLADVQAQIRATVERAFLHLQRCIVADDEYARKWLDAFGGGEAQCEKLGAVHLLWHGIWAFKVGAAGGRTDLVMGSHIDNPAEVERAAIGLVLTEWKKAEKACEAEENYTQGIKQASLYSGGILGGLELADTRYVVVVTEESARGPDTEAVEDGITYRFINIAVKPKVPSQEARSGG